MVQLTSRDEAMLDWMNVVRLADVDAIRWALAAYRDDHVGEPVSVRRANHWIARMAELGYLVRTRPVYRDRQIVWPTHQASGRVAPKLFQQTMRHELAVAQVAGRYLAAGFEWARDRRPHSVLDHQADGVASKGSLVELLEVELTTKTLGRYRSIFESFGRRLDQDGVSNIVYLGTPATARVVERESERFMFREAREHLVSLAVLDAQGRISIAGFGELGRRLAPLHEP